MKTGTFILLLGVAGISGVIAEPPNESLKFHGRLSIYNGTPCYRIWIVGTTRHFGVPGGDEEAAEMPKALQEIFTSTSTDVYADFWVTPLEKYRRGQMQAVRINSVENLVIYRDDQFVERREKL